MKHLDLAFAVSAALLAASAVAQQFVYPAKGQRDRDLCSPLQAPRLE